MTSKIIKYTVQKVRPSEALSDCTIPKIGQTFVRVDGELRVKNHRKSRMNRQFLPAVKAHIQGENVKEVTVPTDHPYFDFLTAIPHRAGDPYDERDTRKAVSLIFRFKGADNAKVNHDEGRRVVREDMILPPFYFAVRIMTHGEDAGAREMKYFASNPFACRGFPHPHTNTAASGWGSFCWGGSNDQIASSLVQDDLTMYLDVLAGFLLGGTNAGDPWGSKQQHFTENGLKKMSRVELRIYNERDAYVGALATLDGLRAKELGKERPKGIDFQDSIHLSLIHI